jgi:hypothetical protein
MRLVEPVRDRWRVRARDPGITEGQSNYAHARAESLSRPYTARLEKCATTAHMVECGCGRRAINRTCGAHLLCDLCRKRRGRKQAARIKSGLLAAWERRARGVRSVLITMTARHTGDIAADRKSIADGWRALRKRYHATWGAFEFAGTWEVTRGTDGLGHIHLHVVALWPFRDWEVIARWWRVACPTSTRINLRGARSVRGGAAYIAKYVSKGVQTGDFSPELRARVLAGTYNTRWLLSSVGFFLPPPCCPGCGLSATCVVLPGSRWRNRIDYARPPDNSPDDWGDGGRWYQTDIPLPAKPH